VTIVFFLFLLHQALGLMLALPFVTARAGERFFKFCAAAAAFMAACALYLLLRRYGLRGAPGAPGEDMYPALLGAGLLSAIGMVLYNRAWHFGWRRLQRVALALSLAAGAVVIALSAPAAQRGVVIASALSSVLLSGAAAAAMILGHYYLVVLDLPIGALRRLTLLLVAGLVLRSIVVGFGLLGPMSAGLAGARLVASGLWSADGIFVWMRLLFGIAGPLSLIGFIWKTVELRSTQSATGILYVQLLLVMSGELLATYLRVAAALPL
jgi:protein NrfD